MKLYNSKNFVPWSIVLILTISCKEPSNIGLNIHPISDRITINVNDSLFQLEINTLSEDSIKSDEPTKLLLGNINQDPMFPISTAYFMTNILLPSNNINLGDVSNIIVDSVVLQYAISNTYGSEISSFPTIYATSLDISINKDSTYFSNFELNFDQSELLSLSNRIVEDSNSTPILKINLDNSIGEFIINGSNQGSLVTNESFLQYFNGLKVSTSDPNNISSSNDNTILYLDAENPKSKLRIFYRDLSFPDSSFTFDLVVGGDAARVNLFNKKNFQQLQSLNEFCYVQSMSSFRGEIKIMNINEIKNALENKIINKVILKFSANDDSQYPSHDRLFLVTKDSFENDIFLEDFVSEGDSHFGGFKNGGKYEFNITRHFSNLIKNNTQNTNILYLVSSGAVVNANRSIILKSSFELEILFSNL